MRSAIFPHSSIVFPLPSPHRSECLPGYVKSNSLTNLHEKHQDCHRTWHIDDWLGRMMGVSESQRYSFNEGTSQLNRKAATMRQNPGICFTWTWFRDQDLDVLVIDRFFSLSHHHQHKHGINKILQKNVTCPLYIPTVQLWKDHGFPMVVLEMEVLLWWISLFGKHQDTHPYETWSIRLRSSRSCKPWHPKPNPTHRCSEWEANMQRIGSLGDPEKSTKHQRGWMKLVAMCLLVLWGPVAI